MTFIAASIIGGGVALAGAGIGAASQGATNAANVAEAEKNRQFQERMSSTSFQRGVADMRAAGINPMLAYSQGGASTAAGSQAQLQSEVSGSVGSDVVSSTMGASTAKANQELIESQKETTDAEMWNKRETRALIQNQTEKTQNEAEVSKEIAKQEKMNTKLVKAGLSSAIANAPVAPYLKTAGDAVRVIGEGAALRNSGKALKHKIDMDNLRGVPVK